MNEAVDQMVEGMIDQNIAADVVRIEQTTIEAIREQIKNGITQELSTAQVTQAIMDIYSGFSSSRALTISRTETGSAASYGQFAAAMMSGMTHKRWVTSRDKHVRDVHGHLEGNLIGMTDKFSNGAMFPADPALVAGERINCRCSMVFERRDQ